MAATISERERLLAIIEPLDIDLRVERTWRAELESVLADDTPLENALDHIKEMVDYGLGLGHEVRKAIERRDES